MPHCVQNFSCDWPRGGEWSDGCCRGTSGAAMTGGAMTGAAPDAGSGEGPDGGDDPAGAWITWVAPFAGQEATTIGSGGTLSAPASAVAAFLRRRSSSG